MPGIDEKENVWRVRQNPPGQYVRYVTIDIDTGIQAAWGFKADGSKEIQSLIFSKKRFKTRDSVKAWIDRHKEYHYEEANEMVMAACYEEFASEEFIEYYEIPFEAYAEVDPDGWLFICREFDLDGRGKVTKADLIEMKENVENNVRGIKLDIDWDHKKRRDDAAGWYGEMKLEKITLQDGREVWALFTKPEWSTEARKALKEKTYRYFSPEIAFKYYDNEKKKWYKNVLFGGGITNRPEIKGQPEIGMAADEGDNKLKEEDKMKLSELMKKIGVSFSETDEDANVKAIGDKFDEQEKTIKKQKDDTKLLTDNIKKLGDEKADAEKVKKELDDKVKTMEEADKDRIKKDADTRVKTLCDKAIKEEKVAPADADFVEKSGDFYKLAASNIDSAEKFLDKMEKLTKKPKGSGSVGGDKDKTDEQKEYDGIKELAEKMMEKDKELKYDDAFEKASVEYHEKGDEGGTE